MKVYIVTRGEQYEGGSTVAIFSNEPAANECATNQQAHFPGGWILESPDYWTNGCDFVRIRAFDVLDVAPPKEIECPKCGCYTNAPVGKLCEYCIEEIQREDNELSKRGF